MNGYNDPRRAVMFTQGYWNKKSDYCGIRVGIDPRDKSTMVEAFSNQPREQVFALPQVQRRGGDVPARRMGAPLGAAWMPQSEPLRGGHSAVVRGAGRFGCRAM